MASDTVQKRSNLLDVECAHRSARVGRVLHVGNKKESGMALVSEVNRDELKLSVVVIVE